MSKRRAVPAAINQAAPEPTLPERIRTVADQLIRRAAATGPDLELGGIGLALAMVANDADKELAKLTLQRDLAAAHDQQPYPTAWAYEQACKAARKHRDRADAAETDRDGAYRERAQLLAWLAALHPAVLALAPDVEEDGWQILYLNPAYGGQMSWHIAPRDADLFEHLEQVSIDDERAQWDGHTTAEKYQRMASLITVLANAAVVTGAPVCVCTVATRCAVCRTEDAQREGSGS